MLMKALTTRQAITLDGGRKVVMDGLLNLHKGQTEIIGSRKALVEVKLTTMCLR